MYLYVLNMFVFFTVFFYRGLFNKISFITYSILLIISYIKNNYILHTHRDTCTIT